MISPLPEWLWPPKLADGDLPWGVCTHRVPRSFGHKVLQDHMTMRGHVTIWKILYLHFYKAYGHCTWNMEYDCHIFSKYLVFQMKNVVFQSKYLALRSKIRNFEKLGFSHLEYEILSISSEIPSISKKVWNPGTLYMYTLA